MIVLNGKYYSDDNELANYCLELKSDIASKEAEITKLDAIIKEKERCAFIGPMKDCPTHGESQELKQFRTEFATLKAALEADPWHNQFALCKQERDKLQAQVATLRESIEDALPTLKAEEKRSSLITRTFEKVLSSTQSSDQRLNEHDAKVLEKAASWFDEYHFTDKDFNGEEVPYNVIPSAEDILRIMASELRSGK